MSADLLHFQFAAPAAETSIGGVAELFGPKVTAQASARAATARRARFIAVVLFVLWLVCSGCKLY
jgi:hypothetical protein